MSDTKTGSWIAALERARAELERVLAGDEGGRGQPDNPVYRCWEQLNGAIEELRKAQAQAKPSTARRRVSLREVLEHIRSDAGLQQDTHVQPEPPSASVEGAPGTSAAAPPVHAIPDAGEATVSFVIREPAREAPVAAPAGDTSAATEPAPPEGPDLGTEAEVTIVRQRR